jgi:hypothetical protein
MGLYGTIPGQHADSGVWFMDEPDFWNHLLGWLSPELTDNLDRNDDAPLAGGTTGPDNETELYASANNIADNRKYQKERFRWT